MINIPAPHFLLYSDSQRNDAAAQWKFVLERSDGSTRLEAEDLEPHTQGERLELLALVRGLEAIPEPSRVTLVTSSRYVNRGLAYGLEQWRSNGWQWEHFGQMVPVKNRDLWQRVDRALEFHELVSRSWRLDAAHDSAAGAPAALQVTAEAASARDSGSRNRLLGIIDSLGDWASELAESLRVRLGHFGTRLLPLPWLE